MKYVLLFISFLVLKSTQAQHRPLFNSPDLNYDKPIVYYTIASWCSANLEDYKLITDTLLKYRKNIYLNLVIDSISNGYYSYSEAIKSLKPDKVVVLNNVYPKRLSKLSELNAYTKELNQLFESNFYRAGPSSLFIVTPDTVTAVPIDKTRLNILSQKLTK